MSDVGGCCPLLFAAAEDVGQIMRKITVVKLQQVAVKAGKPQTGWEVCLVLDAVQSVQSCPAQRWLVVNPSLMAVKLNIML